mgnify:CR=1 FL=1
MITRMSILRESEDEVWFHCIDSPSDHFVMIQFGDVICKGRHFTVFIDLDLADRRKRLHIVASIDDRDMVK